MIRKIEKSDIPQIIDMYKSIFDFEMNEDLYNYWYFNEELAEYDSFVYLKNDEILGHNALIRKKYLINNKLVLAALSSGGMVKPKSSGIFFKILDHSFTKCNFDFVFAFPNNNSLGFFKRLFDFKEIKQTYFSTEDEIKMTVQPLPSTMQRTEKFINWRIDNNPRNQYKIHEIGKNRIITKSYLDSDLDIIYSSRFDKTFVEFVNKELRNFERVNIIHWNETFIKSLGFKPSTGYNSFVLKGIIDIIDFEFQMIDSDVF